MRKKRKKNQLTKVEKIEDNCYCQKTNVQKIIEQSCKYENAIHLNDVGKIYIWSRYFHKDYLFCNRKNMS